MFLLLVVAGGIWLYDRFIGKPRRKPDAKGEDSEPVAVEYARAFFPVILFVFVLRSFIVEPFHIPSGSMMPGLIAGDFILVKFILVKKFSYGIRLPVINKKIVDLGRPGRGDVVVFRFPEDPSVNYIKRAIGLPGDKIVYTNKTLYINGNQVPQYGLEPEMMRESNQRLTQMKKVTENLEGTKYSIYLDPASAQQTFEVTVPDHHYFVMGDNRDRSNDSRYWGFVPDENLVGRAFFIWLSWDRQATDGWFWNRILWGRIGTSII